MKLLTNLTSKQVKKFSDDSSFLTTFSSLERVKDMKAFKSDFGFLCGLTCNTRKNALICKPKHTALIWKMVQQQETSISAYDLKCEITSFVWFASSRNLHGLSAVQHDIHNIVLVTYIR